MDTPDTHMSARQTATNVLAVVGFIAIIGASLWLAAYSTRFVPSVAGRIGSAAVYLGSIFSSSEEPALSVVSTPAASSTITFGEAVLTTTDEITLPVTPPKAPAPTPGAKTSNVYSLGSATTTAPAVQGGLPDLIVNIDAIGYLATTSAESFIASSTVPVHNRPAVAFTIKNVGTGATGTWRWSASIPTQTAYIYQSQPQQSLNPGDRIDYTLGFDQANKGAQTISITANFDRAVVESNSNNNSASVNVTILGS
ncbi:hypothetical protein HY972_02780 [Candidatus Kaiserbacteria bacterium]|nr:hypothetical protein [Candidatus Kaiserbacteria bacterium]